MIHYYTFGQTVDLYSIIPPAVIEKLPANPRVLDFTLLVVALLVASNVGLIRNEMFNNVSFSVGCTSETKIQIDCSTK